MLYFLTMQEDSIQDLLSKFAVAHRQEQIELLKMESARNTFVQILIDLQTSPNNRRMGAMELAKTVSEIRLFRRPIDDIVSMPILQMMSIEKWNQLRISAETSTAKEAKKWKLAREIAAQRRGEIIIRILPKIRSYVIKKFANKGLDVEQLVNEGVIGVARAMEKYNPEKGKKFIDYAMNWVDARVYESFEKAGQISVSSSLAAIRSKIKAARERLMAEYEKNPTEEEIIEDLGISAMDYKRAYFRLDSLDSPVGMSDDGDALTLGETLEDEDGFVTEYDENLAARQISIILESLSGYEREVTLFRLPSSGIEFSEINPVAVNEAMREIKERIFREICAALQEENVKQ